MKRCPTCGRTYTDASLNFCLEDGSPLQSDAPRPDPNATVRYPPARDTAEPPPTEIYRPDSPHITGSPTAPAQQWSPMPSGPVRQKSSNALWWVLGALAIVAVLGIGFVIVLIALANMGGNTNNGNANVRVANTNANTNANANTNVNSSGRNANTSALPESVLDDFSEAKWASGSFQFGDVWYANDEYHMRSKERTFIVMYAPSDTYGTKDATVKVTARSVDGAVPSNGFGLMVHCAQSKTKQLEDYALLIYPQPEPEFEVVMHKDGNQSTLVNRTKSSAIRSGSTPNQLEVRIKGNDLEFYVNGQYLTSIKDSQNYKGGRAGLYTSDAVEVAFDDLEIHRQKPQ
ncbi:MAG TPA: hypothetical protein VIG25_18390 [Pyrinomonadaceae bacterium]|jgi:hypothetical protein